MTEIHFCGAVYVGSVEFAPDGVTVFTCPANPDALPHMVAAALDPTPDQARAIALAFQEWADTVESRSRPNNSLPLLVLMETRP